MALYPINLIVDGRLCTIIGGGRVALRKAEALLACGAKLRVVSPEIIPEFQDLEGSIAFIKRAYQDGDLEDSFLVIAATDDDQTNQEVVEEAARTGLPLNVVDKPEQCNFHVPSSIRRGDLLLTVSTGGQLPALSKRLRQQLEQDFPAEWGPALELLGEARSRVIEKFEVEETKRECLSQLAQLDLVGIIQEKGTEAARTEIDRCISLF